MSDDWRIGREGNEVLEPHGGSMLELLAALVELLVSLVVAGFHLVVLGIDLVGGLIGLMIEGRGRNPSSGPPDPESLDRVEYRCALQFGPF